MTNIIKVVILLACTQLASTANACTKCNSKKKSPQKLSKFVWSKERSSLDQDKSEISQLFKWFEDRMTDHQTEIEEHEKVRSRYARKVKYKSNNTLETKRLKLEIGRESNVLSSDHDHFLKDHKKLMAMIKKLRVLQKELKSHGHNH
jgi:hypothetical protein